jgi:hypothetical protein
MRPAPWILQLNRYMITSNGQDTTGNRIESMAAPSSRSVCERRMDLCFMLMFGAGTDALFRYCIARAARSRETQIGQGRHIQSIEGP